MEKSKINDLKIFTFKMISLPKNFQNRILRVWGNQAEVWIKKFPSILDKCISQWNLTISSIAPDLTYNFIAFAKTDYNQEVVLKIGVPDPEAERSLYALNNLQGPCMVTVLQTDIALNACLLKKLHPGKPLNELNDNKLETSIASEIMNGLPGDVPTQHRFLTIKNLIDVFTRISKKYSNNLPISGQLIQKAETIANELIESTNQPKLLHGDLHHTNILYDDQNGWIAIDPKGIIGDPAYEAARYLHNPIGYLLSSSIDPISLTKERLEIISFELKIEKDRVLAWAFVDCVLCAGWCIEDNEKNMDYFICCAQIMEKLLK